MTALESGLASVLNRHSQENASNTPDFILAQYLLACLGAWNTAVQQRETWYWTGSASNDGHRLMPATLLSERLKPVDEALAQLDRDLGAGLATTAPEMLQVANALHALTDVVRVLCDGKWAVEP